MLTLFTIIAVLYLAITIGYFILNNFILNKITKSFNCKWIYLSRALADLDYQLQEIRKEIKENDE